MNIQNLSEISCSILLNINYYVKLLATVIIIYMFFLNLNNLYIVYNY